MLRAPFGRSLALVGLVAVAELAMDDWSAECALGGVVRRLDAGCGGEGPERGPDLEQRAGEAPTLAVAGVLDGVLVQERTVEERAGYFYILAKTCAKAGMTDRTLQYMRKALENGFKDRDKFKAEPEFSALQDNLEFQEILAAEYKVL